MKPEDIIIPLPAPLPPALEEALNSGRLPHAILLEGPAGSGRLEAAVTLASRVLGPKVLELSHCDVIIVDGKSDPDAFKVGRLRDLRLGFYEKPVEGVCKFYIFPDAQELSPAAQNLLLKAIEEPPEGCRFIFTCTNRCRLLATVLSRVICYSIPRITVQDCASMIRRRFPGEDASRCERASVLADGSPGLAASLLKDKSAAAIYDAASELVSGLNAGKPYRVLTAAAPYEKKRDQYSELLHIAASLSVQPAFRDRAGIDPRAFMRMQRLFPPLLALCDANTYVPLISSLLVKRGCTDRDMP